MSVKLKAPAHSGHARVVPQRPHPVGDWKVVALRLAGGAVVLWGLFSLIGVLVTHVLVHGPVQSVDRGVEVWFAARRTGVWSSVTMFGADMAETQVAIAVTVVVVLLLRWRLGRWYESWIMVAAMLGELLVFYSVTATVHRPRPPVVRLDVAPPTSSFRTQAADRARATCTPGTTSRRVSARLIPGRALSPRFRCRFILSTLQRWFTRVRLPGPRLTALTPPFPHRSPRQSSASAACGGLTPPPAGRRRRATKPSSCVQQAHRVIASYSGDSFPRTRRKIPR